MSADAVQAAIDAVADLQLKVGAGGVGRDRILVTLLPPPADPAKRDLLRRMLDDLVPELLTRYEPGGALPPGYELTRQGWLRSKHAPRVLEVVKAFLAAFRAHMMSASTAPCLEWADVAAQGVPDSDYHLACVVAKCFELQNGGSSQTAWGGRHPPQASFGLPIDVDELLDVVDPNELAERRERVSPVRLHARKVIAKEITGHIRRGVEAIYRVFSRTGSWPLSRTLHVELAKEGIDLDRIASSRFARGHDIHTEGARTMLTLSGLLIPAEAEDDRNLVVQVLRFVGEWARGHPEDRTVNALTVIERTGIEESDVIAVAKMLQSQGGVYVMSVSDTFDVNKMLFYLSPKSIPHAEAKDLWDIVLNEEEELRRWQLRALEGVMPASEDASDDLSETDEGLDDEIHVRDVEVPTPPGADDRRASRPDAAWIFYSWQSDLDHKTNWNFIEDCLGRATKAIRKDDSVLVDPVIDRDTQGVAGSPDIGATIFAKIADSTAFVCDVSCINRGVGGRPTPNPNVLIELGYAAGVLGWDRIVLVLNEAFGPVEDLPFDLRVKRTIRYRLAPGEARAEVRAELTKRLEVAIRTILVTSKRPAEEVARTKAAEDAKAKRVEAQAKLINVDTARAQTNRSRDGEEENHEHPSPNATLGHRLKGDDDVRR